MRDELGAVRGSRATTMRVSSPAMVPTTSCRAARSSALASECAPPEVCSGPQVPARVGRHQQVAHNRTRPRPALDTADGAAVVGITYKTGTPPSAPRSLTAPSSSRSRESVP